MKLNKENKELTKYERVKKAINFEKQDRIPVQHFFSPELLQNQKDELMDIFSKYPEDFGPSDYSFPDENSSKCTLRRYYSTIEVVPVKATNTTGDRYVDRWGTEWEKAEEGSVEIEPALPDYDELDTLEIPSPYPDTDQYKEEKEKIQKEKEETERYMLGYNPYRDYIFGGFTFFERVNWLRGLEECLYDIGMERKGFFKLLDKLHDAVRESVKQTMELGVDGIYFTEDWGSQRGMLINPERWESIFKPYYDDIFELIHNMGGDVFFHSCGDTTDIVPGLIDAGVDVLNVQMPIMDLKKLSKITRGEVCILTELDRQDILPEASPEEVYEHASEIVELFADNKSGVIGRGKIGLDVPMENAEAMLSAFYNF